MRVRLSESEFSQLREEQELKAEFKEFPELLLSLLDELRDNGHSAELEMISDRKAQFSLLQQASNKEFNLLSLELYREEEQVVKQMVAYRYSVLRAEIDRMEGRVLDVREMLRVKNPYLLATFDQF